MRIVDTLVAALLVAGLVAAGAWIRDRQGDTVDGPFRVVDGDTLAGGHRRVRLAGMDAPELRQTCEASDGRPYLCGEVARGALERLAAGAAVHCRIAGRDRYDRDLGHCEASGLDLGREMVRRGQAVAFGEYAAEQARARDEKLGLWAGSFATPADWRRAHPRLLAEDGGATFGASDRK